MPINLPYIVSGTITLSDASNPSGVNAIELDTNGFPKTNSNHKNNRYKINHESLYDLYINQWKTITQISQLFGCSSEWIRKCLNKFGIKIRHQSEYSGDKSWNKGIKRSEEFKDNLRGKNNYNYKRGWYIDTTGYKRVLYNNKYVKEHQLNWCIANDFPIIPRGFCIHHRDENRLNNKPENLVLLSIGIHQKAHMAWRNKNAD